MEAHFHNTGFNTRATVPEVSPDTLLRFLESLENSRIATADCERIKRLRGKYAKYIK